MRRLLAISRKEWLQIRRDARTLGVILVLPVFLLVLNGYAINFDLRHLRFALCDLDGSAASRALRESLLHTELFSLAATVPTVEAGEKLLQRGECLFVLVIPPGMEADLAHGRAVTLQMLVDGSDSNTASVARGYMDGALRTFAERLQADAAQRRGIRWSALQSPIRIERRFLYNAALDSRQFMVPGLFAVIMIILGALLTATSVVRERERGSFEALAASPVRTWEILVGKALPYAVIAIVAALIAVAAAALAFHVYIAGSFVFFLLATLLFLGCALAMGLLISALARTQQVALTAAILTTFLPALLLSGFAFPIRNMPPVLQAIAAVIPATHFLVICRGIYLKGIGPEPVWWRLVYLLGFALIVTALSVRRFRKEL